MLSSEDMASDYYFYIYNFSQSHTAGRHSCKEFLHSCILPKKMEKSTKHSSSFDPSNPSYDLQHLLLFANVCITHMHLTATIIIGILFQYCPHQSNSHIWIFSSICKLIIYSINLARFAAFAAENFAPFLLAPLGDNKKLCIESETFYKYVFYISANRIEL